MASLNKVQLIGNAGRDCEMRYLANGTATANFTLAVNRRIPPKGGSGDWTDETEWFNVVAWSDLAERISPTVKKGKQLYIEGRLQSRSWENNEGVKQTRMEVIANTILLLGRNESGEASDTHSSWDSGKQKPTRKPNQDWGDDDDVPF